MKNKVHLAQLGFISGEVCEPWRAQIHKSHINTQLMSAHTHLESVHVIFQPIDPAGQGRWVALPCQVNTMSNPLWGAPWDMTEQ